MKKLLLLGAAAMLVASAANAQLLPRYQQKGHVEQPNAQIIMPQVEVKEMHMLPEGQMPKRIAKAEDAVITADYIRPAGAFAGSVVIADGAYSGSYYAPYLFMKPFVEYTFVNNSDNVTDAATYTWDVQHWTSGEQIWEQYTDKDLTFSYRYETDSVPQLTAVEGSSSDTYFMHGYKMSGTSSAPVVDAEYSSYIAAVPETESIWERTILRSSKSFYAGGKNGDKRYTMTYYSGATAYGSNESGWWFGKNASNVNGIGQAFEKPTAPYLLKQVVLITAILDVAGETEMTCKIWKIDSIPAYKEDGRVYLNEEPGELIATGKATIDANTDETTSGAVFFTLYQEEDGMEYETNLTVDYPILVTIDGYNDNDSITDISAMISADMATDEGYGELAYLQRTYTDSLGNETTYWSGLNNFFSSGEMKTGLTIFLDTELPYLTFNYTAEDGEYTFPVEGGEMEKVIYQDEDTTISTHSIEFYAWTASADDAWSVTTVDGDDIPDWLTITLTDEEDDEGFTGLVNAVVTATALPTGYREATVRFGFPGAYIDYKFMQGEKSEAAVGDVNADGEVNISDVNALISIILGNSKAEDYAGVADVNGDAEINISDVNAVIAIILGNEE